MPVGEPNVLVVATVSLSPGTLRAHAARLGLEPASSVRIVSPASRLSPAKWLTNEEDQARETASSIAGELAEEVEKADGTSVEADVGDTDPLRAAEDALATFPADELVVLLRPESEASWLERSAVEKGFERFGLPVRYVVVGEPASREE